ncbi:MAG TPA: beta-galactosidase [Tepidisphaeraceae bacterium]|jgi:beta-galactosidase|nr:beta-galactosidase [Tepidisphaeraceae bacterium]
MAQKPVLRLGAAWYPEQWGRDVLEQDVRLMVQLGINAVRVGEFAWARFEPAEGRFETQWMRDAMDLAHAHDIGVVLCTPTATPPAWLLHTRPELGYVDQSGRQYGHGGRQQADYNNPLFRDYCRCVNEAVAQGLGDHPALIAWQTDNELRGHQKLSLSEPAIAGWHEWLRARYDGDIEALNASWGTEVWSQRYGAFEQVPAPWPLPTYSHSMSLLTNYRRYMNDSVVAFQREQIEVIRKYSYAPITHNSEDSVDEWDLTRELDFAATDTYVDGHHPEHVLYRFDCFRCLKAGTPFWTMETGSEGYLYGELAPAGWLPCFAMMNFASGSHGLSYWPWRQQRAGAEIDHNAIVSVAGRPSSGWHEIEKISKLRQQLEPLLREFRPARAPAAFVRSETNGHFFFVDRVAGLEPNFNFRARLEEEYQTLRRLGLWRDVIYDQAPVTGYRIVFSPYLPHASSDFLQRMREHLENGGAWVAGPYCGYRDRDHTVPTEGELGAVEAMLGFRTKFTLSLGKGTGNGITLANGTRAHASMRSIVFDASVDDEVLGTYDHPRLGKAAWGISRPFGKGRIYVLGSRIEPAERAVVYGDILRREGIDLVPTPERVSLFPHTAVDGRKAWAIVNWDAVPHVINLPATGRDMLDDGRRVGTAITVAPFTSAFVIFDGA